MKTITWISGWGVPPEWLQSVVEQRMHDCAHQVLPPTAETVTDERLENAEFLGGYSLGAFLLLRASAAREIQQPAILLAPFFAYPAEANLGGRIRNAQIRYLARWLKRNPEEALRDFYTRSGLRIPNSFPTPPYSMEELQWGLEILERERVPVSIPRHWKAVCGDQDPLLDTTVIKNLAPAVDIVSGAGHDPETLLSAVCDK